MLVLSSSQKIILEQLVGDLSLLLNFLLTLFDTFEGSLIILVSVRIFLFLYCGIENLICLIRKPLQALIGHAVVDVSANVEIFLDGKVNDDVNFLQLQLFFVFRVGLADDPKSEVDIFHYFLFQQVVYVLEVFLERVGDEDD